MSVRLEPLGPHHARALQPLLEDPAIAATTPFPHPYPPDGAMAYVRESVALRNAGSKYVFAVCTPGGVPIGMALLKDVDPRKGEAELGYWIGRPYWGLGYATEAAAAALTHAFAELGLESVLAVTLEANPASLRVLAKLGFVEVGRPTWDLPKWPEPRPCISLRLSADAWRISRGRESGDNARTSRVPAGDDSQGHGKS
jgi:[ribosomal protein S5]-alanine N-acetyltransferase